MASARTCGERPAAPIADVIAAEENPVARRLLASVLRFWAKACRARRRKLCSCTPSSAKRGANLQRKTVENTSGGGTKAEGGSVNSGSAGPYICTVSESR